jgi:NADH-quinone oxidoreductase subunit A
MVAKLSQLERINQLVPFTCMQVDFIVVTTGGDIMAAYINNYLVVLIFLLLGVLLPVGALTAGRFLRPAIRTQEKETTYESGAEPFGGSWVRFNVQYYLFALMFFIFDVETVFLYPWAVAFDKLGVFGLIEMLIFIVMLALAFIYAWKKKVLEWN